MTRPPMRRAAALVCLAALTTACVPEAATSQGRDVAWLYNIFMLASAGVTLTFKLGQGLTCTDTTNSEGFASCSVTPGPTATVPATYTVAFAGTNAYQEATETGPVVPSAQQP